MGILRGFSLLYIMIMGAVQLQGQYQLSGIVTDSDKGKALSGVELFNVELNKTVITNQKGEYLMADLPAGNYSLIVFTEDYMVQNLAFDVIGEDLVLDVAMDPLNYNLPEVELQAQRSYVFSLRRMKDVEGMVVYAGKKNEVVQLGDALANVAANNARQIYSQVTGLNIYEGDDAGLQLNIGGRGLDPNRTSSFNTISHDL